MVFWPFIASLFPVQFCIFQEIAKTAVAEKKLMEKGSELSPSECFPNEIWELIFVWLDRVRRYNMRVGRILLIIFRNHLVE